MKPQRARHLIRAVIIVLGGVALLASRPTKETVPSSLGATLRTAADTTIELAKGTTTDSGREFDAFAEWSIRYAEAATLAERQALETTGVALARARRAALAQHIQLDPERALELTIPPGMRRRLPAAVTELLEHQVKGRGDLAVMAALPEPGQECSVEPVWRVASVNGEEYRAYVYGRRLGEPTRRGIPLSGIEVDHLMAVRENPLVILPAEEAAPILARAAVAVCPVSGEPLTEEDEPVVAEAGEEVHILCGAGHAMALNQELIAAESGGPSGGGDVEASAWTEGVKKVLLIRVDFPDLTGLSLTETGGETLINNLQSFYGEMSYGRAGFAAVGAGSDVTPVFRMSNIASYYGGNDYYNQLRSEARSAAAAAGYALANYDLDVICMGTVPGWGWSGLAYVGSAGAWLRNSFGTGVAGHELGHNFGLNHAGFWDTSGASIIGPGANIEYGDSFDTMGAASAGNNHFNARYKTYLNWLRSGETTSVTSSGTYRIYAHDQSLTSGSRGLRIVKDSATNYWVEFRQKFSGNKWLMNGATLRWAGNSNQRSMLLDTTPGSPDARNDAALVIGRTFADPAAGIFITPVSKGGTTPESLDVVVNLGGFAGNVPPVASVSASQTTAATGASISFQAPATDANGDTLAYYWDFGDGNFGTNSPNATKSWTAAGEYVVRCTVTDMKGGEVSDSVVVTIGSPSTFSLSGSVNDGSGPIANARVYVSTSRVAYTDSDGTYTLTGLPAGTYTVNASLYPHTFVPVGFTNPISVGPSLSDISFLSTVVTPPAITGQPQSLAVDPGMSATFNVAVTGTQPISYQWRFNGSNIAGANGSSYTRNNVQAGDTGNYSVVASNSAGSVTSANAVLSLRTPPVIVTQPQSREVLAGSNVTFSVTASGTSPLAYQWKFNGVDISGATSASFTRTSVQPAHAGSYSVVVSNSFGSVTSAPASLSVNFSLTATATAGGRVTVQPAQASYAPNSVVTLTAESTSVYGFSGWSGDASGTVNPLTVVVTSNLNISAVFTSPVADIIVDNPAATFTGNWATATTATDKYGSNYRTVGGSVNSMSASASFTPGILTAGRYDLYVWTPTITKPASSVPVVVSGSAGTQNLSLNQSVGPGGWRLLASGVAFPAGTTSFVRLANNVGQGGKTVAADAVRWTYSLTQEETPPQFLSQPQDVTVNQGDEAAFTVQSGGTAPLSYQWRFNGADIPNATDATLVLPGVQPAQAGEYTVVVSNTLGSIASNVATLTVLGAPVLTSEPRSLSVGVGESAVFNAAAEGAAPLTYQWRRDDADLADDDRIRGANSRVLTIDNAVPGDAGVYTVAVSNDFGSVLSGMAFLSVGIEGDAVPGPYGDNLVMAEDQDFIGRVLTGLAESPATLAFAQIDSAPRADLGDGVISLCDWVQAGRYAASLDPPTPTGGPAGPLSAAAVARGLTPQMDSLTTIKVVGSPLQRGQDTAVTIELDSQGDANAVAFTLNFDPAVLTYRSLEWIDDAGIPVRVVNANEVAGGRIAIVAGASAGTSLPAGTRQLMRLSFAVAAASAASESTIGFAEQPALREVASAAATELTAEFQNTVLPLLPDSPPEFQSMSILPTGEVELTFSGSLPPGFAIQASDDMVEWAALPAVPSGSGTITVVDSAASAARRRFYRVGRIDE
jgi:hypothetical protein